MEFSNPLSDINNTPMGKKVFLNTLNLEYYKTPHDNKVKHLYYNDLRYIV